MPASLGDPASPIYARNLIVVGGVNIKTGKREPDSNVDVAKRIPHVYAAWESQCPWRVPHTGRVGTQYQYTGGTSPGKQKRIFTRQYVCPLTNLQAAAAVAGVAAYFISLSERRLIREKLTSGELVKKHIMSIAQTWADDPSVRYVYNGVTPDQAKNAKQVSWQIPEPTWEGLIERFRTKFWHLGLSRSASAWRRQRLSGVRHRLSTYARTDDFINEHYRGSFSLEGP